MDSGRRLRVGDRAFQLLKGDPPGVDHKRPSCPGTRRLAVAPPGQRVPVVVGGRRRLRLSLAVPMAVRPVGADHLIRRFPRPCLGRPTRSAWSWSSSGRQLNRSRPVRSSPPRWLPRVAPRLPAWESHKIGSVHALPLIDTVPRWPGLTPGDTGLWPASGPPAGMRRSLLPAGLRFRTHRLAPRLPAKQGG